MIDELLSGLLGSTLAELAKRRWPPRKVVAPQDQPWERASQRNQLIYQLTVVSGAAVFLAVFVYMLAGGWHHSAWQVGEMFGLPFSAMAATVIVATLPMGGYRRTAEFLRYWELRERLNIWVMVIAYSPLAVLGILSLLMSAARGS